MMSKIPIQAIPREGREPRQRTSRACDACRARKMKCNGELPKCSQCESQGLDECSYSDKKNVRERKSLRFANQTIDKYERLLRDLSLVVDEEYAARIADALEETRTHRGRPENDSHDKADSLSSLHSLDAMSTVDEDLNRNEMTRATGYHGEISEVSWIKHLSSNIKEKVDKLRYVEHPQQQSVLPDSSTAEACYHLDEQYVTVPLEGDPLDLPAASMADGLIGLYFRHVNPFLPIIREDLFKKQCSQLYKGGSQTPSRRWIAVFNLVLAIGARFRWMTQAGDQADDDVFFAKARSLNIVDSVLKDNGDLQQVQVQSLMAFYFLVSSRINRAWKAIGIASRSAIALGLNLHSTHEFAEEKSFDARVNLWWSIFQLDTLLSLMTGRPSGLGETSFMAPLPLEFSCSEAGADLPRQASQGAAQKQNIKWTIYQSQKGMDTQQAYLNNLAPSRSLSLFYLIDLTLITHTIANRVFSVDVFQDGWSAIERRIAFYNVRMGQWQTGLHPSVQFADDQGRPLSGPLSAFQTALAFHYYSSRIVLNRPCFSRTELDNKTQIQFPRSHFGNQTASNCLRASLRLISLLPDEPDMDWCFFVAPWWSLLHFVVQALTILLIHMSISPASTGSLSEGSPAQIDPLPATDASSAILAAVRKAIYWLSSLGRSNEAASRAFERCYACLRLVAVTKGINLRDMAPYSTFTKSPHKGERSQEQFPGNPPAESPTGSSAGSSDFFYSPFASFGSVFDVQGHTSDPAHSQFEDMLASLMDEGP